MSLSRRQFVLTTGAATAGILARPDRLFAQQPSRPNLLFILADDLGYGDISAFGRPDYKTPNIDRLVAEGVRFSNAYTAASTCTPTRVGWATGRYPQRQHPDLQRPMGWGTDASGLPTYGLSPEVPTIARMIKRAGYDTALVGKWHLGFQPEFSPLRHGFDEFFGIKGGGADYFTHTGRRNVHELYEGDVTAERAGYMTELLSDRAIAYVSRKRERPFYLSLHYTAPHWPWEGPADTHGDSLPHDFTAGGSQMVFREMMKSLDDGIGRVMRALDGAGRSRDTIVIFTSDNGGERYSYNWPWSNGKFTLHEGGIRVPAAMRWVGTLSARSCDQLTITMDWTATMVAAAGASPEAGLDGIDLMPFARGMTSTERTLFWRQPDPIRTPHAAARRGPWKYLRVGTDEFLHDLGSDPGEKSDLKARHPHVLAELREAWNQWDAQMEPMRHETTPP
ncbi:MAG: sulfatase-like hydrolase/transferase [Gemmatimonadaceae bacterium]